MRLAGVTCHGGVSRRPTLPTTSRPAVLVVGFPPPGQPAVSLSPVVSQATREIIPGWLRRSTPEWSPTADFLSRLKRII